MKKTFKRGLCVLLTLVMLMSVSAVAFAKEKCDCGHPPVIFVSGFGATYLKEIKDDGSEEIVFPPTPELIVSILKNNLDKINIKDIRDYIYAVIEDILEPVTADENGNPYHHLEPIYSSVEDTSYDGFVRNDATKYIPYGDSNFLDMKSSAERIGGDHVFNFLYDWRLSGDEAADLFLEYIEDVREYTGHDKVSVHCLSQGAVPVAQYLYKYSDKGYIDNLVFENPILDGSDFVSDLLGGRDNPYYLDYDEVLDLLEEIIHVEFNISELVGYVLKEENYEGINTQVKLAAENVIFPIAKTSPAYLEMVPSEQYSRVCAEYYTQPIIDRANKVMNGYRADIEGTLRKAMADGVDLTIFASSGLNLVTGTKVSSDSIVNLTSACGAYVAPAGTKFPADYVQKVNNGKNSISPDRTIDLSCGYVPERTWILNERYHCMLEWSPITLALTEERLFTHNIKDAYSSAEFPQFIQTDDPNHYIHASFDNTNCLYAVKGEEGRLILRNTSTKAPLLIKGVTVSGADITDDLDCPVMIRPGEKASLTVDTSKVTSGDITVEYYAGDNFCQIKERVFGYSVTDNYSGVMNSDTAETVKPSFIDSAAAKLWLIAGEALSKVFSAVERVISLIKK